MLKIIKQKILYLIKLRRVMGIILVISICFFLCACENVKYEDNTIFTEDEEKDLFNYTYVQLGDLALTHEISCKYVQAVSEDYSFSVKDRLIQAIYVGDGDIVKKNQLLAELENDNIDAKIRDSNYLIEKNTLLIQQAKEQKDVDLQEAKDHNDIKNNTSADKNDYANKINDIKDSYNETIEGYENTIAVEKLKLDSYKKEDEESRIYAGISGTVSFIKPNLVGTYSDPEDKIISIVDNANCVYVTDDMDYKSYFMNADQVDLHVGSGNDGTVYKIKPTEISSWKDQMVFTLKDESYTPKVGDTGTIYAVLDHRENVLYVDNNAVHKANDEYYVYILDDQGNRVMQPVTIGLKGNDSTEIVDGLKKGEQVVLEMNSFWGE